METIEQKRCQYTIKGIETFKKQRLGYAKEKRSGDFSVRWDGRKSWSHYHKDFIDVSPLLALYSDDEIAEIAKEKEPQITPQTIDLISKNLEYIKNTGLSEKALVVLLHDYIGASNINKKQILHVLSSLPFLRNYYLTPSHQVGCEIRDYKPN